MNEVEQIVQQWRSDYEADDACVAYLLCDRHDPAAVAFSFIDDDLSVLDLTYGELAQRSAKLATVLAQAGVAQGDRVPVLLGKRPELVITLLAIWRLGAVHVPLFTAFATGAIELRVSGSAARLVITEPGQASKLDPIEGIEVLQIGAEWETAIDAATAQPLPVAVGPTAPFLQLYTSGTTGKPKGVPVPVRALGGFHSYLHFGLDESADDVFWNAADPAWAYGLYYAITAPMVAGRRSLICRSPFTPEQTATVIQRYGVTNFAGAPTMYRALSKSGALSGLSLRRASSAGEPLTPDVVEWAREALGTEVRDHYGQTELGMVIGNAWHDEVAQPLKEGSMGQPLPGHAAGIVDGVIAIDLQQSPLLWFTGYNGDPELSAGRFSDDGRWYLTGDTGRRDDDGYFYFAARDDDLILAAGYRIGPFDVESVLITHSSVVDVAVVGLPDPEGIRGEVVAAFVVLSDPALASPELVTELQDLVRDRYSRHAYPRSVQFVETLPKTPSGKIQRYLLRR